MQEANISNNQKAKREDNFLDKIVNNQLDVDTDDLVFQLGQNAVHKLDWDRKKDKLISYIQSLNNALNEKVKELEENKNNINKINELNAKIKELEETIGKKDSSIEHITRQVSEERKLKHLALERENELKNNLKEKDDEIAECIKYKDQVNQLEKEIERRDKISKSKKNFKKNKE